MNKIYQLHRDNAQRVKPVALTAGVVGTVADLYIYDVISADWGVAALDVVGALAQARGAETLNIHINSPGGDVFESKAIIAAIGAFRGKTVAIIDGLCASAATSIAHACNEVEMAPGGFFMIHDAMCGAFGNGADLRTCADLLDKISLSIANGYVERTGKPLDEVQALMQAETWFDAPEALAAGLIDRISEKPAVANTWNLAVYAKAPVFAPANVTKDHKQEAETLTTEQRDFLNRKLRLRIAAHRQ